MYGLEQNSGRNSARKSWRLRHGKDEVAWIAWREDVVPEEQPKEVHEMSAVYIIEHDDVHILHCCCCTFFLEGQFPHLVVWSFFRLLCLGAPTGKS